MKILANIHVAQIQYIISEYVMLQLPCVMDLFNKIIELSH